MGDEKTRNMEIKRRKWEGKSIWCKKNWGRVRRFKYSQSYDGEIWWPYVPDVLRQSKFLCNFFLFDKVINQKNK